MNMGGMYSVGGARYGGTNTTSGAGTAGAIGYGWEKPQQPRDSVTISQQLFKRRTENASDAFSAGDRVRHAVFGVGEILSVRPMGSDTLYEIAFEKVGTKKMMATYAKLKKES